MFTSSKLTAVITILLLFYSCSRDESVNPVIDNGLPPAVPVGLRFWRSFDGQIGIEWLRNNQSGIDGYNIYRSISDTGNFTKVNFTNNDFYLDTGLEYDSTYFYKITSVNIFQRESIPTQIISSAPKNIYSPLTPFDLKINARNWNDSEYVFISWQPTGDTDIKHYEIYRDTNPNFEVGIETTLGKTDLLDFTDYGNTKLLTQYYYKIIAVDKGGLKSKPSKELTDIILDLPKAIEPSDNSEVNEINGFKILTVSVPANYKIIIQKNMYFDVVGEINFSSSHTDSTIFISANNIIFEPYREYFWRVVAYSKFSSEPNSFSELNKFKLVP